MWSKFLAWHRAWEASQIAILQDPALAESAPAGIQRWTALQVANMSAIERRQLLDFSLKYRGRRTYYAMAKLVLVFSIVGALFYLTTEKASLGVMVLLFNVIGFGLCGVALTGYFNYRMLVGKGFIVVMTTVFLLGSAGYVVGAGMAARDSGRDVSKVLKDRWFRVLWVGGGVGMLFMVPLGGMAMVRNRQYHRLVAQLELDSERERSARELSESRLRLLHAQIEPHFLFNTLGAVQQLAERESPRAAALTGHLIDFLRASMQQMRNETTTLASDFNLVEDYLEVMQARLGERLHYSLDLPPALANVELPSMLLLTLVENSIKHGIEPALRGGHIDVRAEATLAGIRLVVCDSGAGLAPKPGESGEGLNNVRKRLQLKYGSAATFSIADGPEGGAVADIILPVNQTPSP